MKDSGISFHRFHICELNISDETRCKFIIGGDTILVYLPCKFFIDNTISEDAVHSSLENDQTYHAERIETVRNIIHDILLPFVDEPYNGFRYVNNSGRSFHCHAVLVRTQRISQRPTTCHQRNLETLRIELVTAVLCLQRT